MRFTKQQFKTCTVICGSVAIMVFAYLLIVFSKQNKAQSTPPPSPPSYLGLPLPNLTTNTPTSNWYNLHYSAVCKYEEAIWHMSYYLEDANKKTQEDRQAELQEVLVRLQDAQLMLNKEYEYIYLVIAKDKSKDWGKRLEICFMRRGNAQRFIEMLKKTHAN